MNLALLKENKENQQIKIRDDFLIVGKNILESEVYYFLSNL